MLDPRSVRTSKLLETSAYHNMIHLVVCVLIWGQPSMNFLVPKSNTDNHIWDPEDEERRLSGLSNEIR